MVHQSSIKDKNNKIFNYELKADFLKTISEQTAKYYTRIFMITATYEAQLQKDLYHFTFEEIEKILYAFEAKNRHTIETYGRVISSYLNWCVQQGIIAHNPLAPLKPDDFDKYVIHKEHYLTEKQLRHYEDQCTNFQDAVILRLLFEGIAGKEFSEIANLKKTDVDFQNKTLYLINSLKVDQCGLPVKYTERTIKVSDRALYLIKGAMEQKIYMKRNGFMSTASEHVREYTDLVQNDYVVRASITRNSPHWNSPVDKYVLYRRIQVISETLGINHLTAKWIQRSGMIYLASQLIGDAEEVTLDDLKIIADRFNLKSYHNLKSFLTYEHVRETYPI